jgi:hypothetical protein
MRFLVTLAVMCPVTLTACSSLTSSSVPSSPAPAATPAAATREAAASPAPSRSCALKTTFDYIVRDAEPGLPALAQVIGNVDLANCTPTLQDFAQTAGQAQGECTSIALASANPGYNVNASPAPPLRKVLMRAGPGC